MRLVVGLGNPGKEYQGTPHNLGFWVCDEFADRYRLPEEVQKFRGLFRRGRALGEDVGVLKPQTYMNLSGESVVEALRYLPIEAEDLVVVYDDMDLPVGRLRIRPSGGHGGHNGMRSLIAHLGTKDFPRIRVGVGRPPGKRSATKHLLSKVRKEDRDALDEATRRAVDATEKILKDGVQAAMNEYNGLSTPDAEEEMK